MTGDTWDKILECPICPPIACPIYPHGAILRLCASYSQIIKNIPLMNLYIIKRYTAEYKTENQNLI